MFPFWSFGGVSLEQRDLQGRTAVMPEARHHESYTNCFLLDLFLCVPFFTMTALWGNGADRLTSLFCFFTLS